MFDWDEYLDLSRELVKQNINIARNDACLRTAASRAYYAAYNKAAFFAHNNGGTLTFSGKDHKEVEIFLSNHPNPKIKLEAPKLGRLKQLRFNSDYKPETVITAPNVLIGIDQAEAIINAIP